MRKMAKTYNGISCLTLALSLVSSSGVSGRHNRPETIYFKNHNGYWSKCGDNKPIQISKSVYLMNKNK
jgi:hypothetical protein